MADIALQFIAESGVFDLAVAAGDLLRDDGFESAVWISLFADARARPEQIAPGEDKTRLAGWWADTLPASPGDSTGSLLWLLRREKMTRDTLNRGKSYAAASLRWMVEDLVAASVEVATSYPYPGRPIMRIDVAITRPDARRVEYRFDYEWQAQAAKRVK